MAATNGEHKIVIEMPTDTGETDSGQKTASPASPQMPENDVSNPVDSSKKKSGGASLALAVSAAKDIAMQGVNAHISNIGISTGNYYKQQQAQRTMSGIQTMVGLAMSMKNPITGIVAIAGIGISAYSEYKQQKKEREIADYKSEQYAKRLGYTRERR